MVAVRDVAWQNKSISRGSDFRGVLLLGLLAAWFYFVWRFTSLPPFAGWAANRPLLAAVLAKGQYMPDIGMVIAGFAAFHARRELRQDWDWRIGLKVYLATVLPLLAYLAMGVVLLEIARMAGPAGAPAGPWRGPLMAIPFQAIAIAILAAMLWPFLLHVMWTAMMDVPLAGAVLTLIYLGMEFSLGWHQDPAMTPVTLLVDFVMGVCLCAVLFRTVEYLVPVRGAMLILGWMTVIAASILVNPALVFLGFLLVVSGGAISERSGFLPGERGLLILSRTALAVIVVQPAVLYIWAAWGLPVSGPGWLACLASAVVAQLLGILLFLAVGMPARRLLPAVPA